jgi:hypothetical protein
MMTSIRSTSKAPNLTRQTMTSLSSSLLRRIQKDRRDFTREARQMAYGILRERQRGASSATSRRD